MFFDANGVKIEYFGPYLNPALGDAERGDTGLFPVLLIHGYLGGDMASDWEQTGVLPKLVADGYRVFVLHCRAHGQSDAPHDPVAYGQEMVHDVVRLLDHLGITEAHLVGWSMGALLAANVALRFPERVARAVLLASGPASAEQYKSDTGIQAAIHGTVERLEAGSGGFPIFTYLSPTDRPEAVPSESEAGAILDEALVGRDPLALAALLRSWGDLVVEDARLPQATVPSLAIIGSADRPASHVATLAEQWPGLQVEIIPGGDHWFQGVPDGWGRVTKSLTAFLHGHLRNSMRGIMLTDANRL